MLLFLTNAENIGQNTWAESRSCLSALKTYHFSLFPFFSSMSSSMAFSAGSLHNPAKEGRHWSVAYDPLYRISFFHTHPFNAAQNHCGREREKLPQHVEPGVFHCVCKGWIQPRFASYPTNIEPRYFPNCRSKYNREMTQLLHHCLLPNEPQKLFLSSNKMTSHLQSEAPLGWVPPSTVLTWRGSAFWKFRGAVAYWGSGGGKCPWVPGGEGQKKKSPLAPSVAPPHHHSAWGPLSSTFYKHT